MAINWYLIGESTNDQGHPVYDIVFHADVPAQTNNQGYSIRQQVAEQLNPDATAVPWLVGTQTEIDMIAGLIYEQQTSFMSFPGETLGALVLRIDSKAQEKAAALLAQLQASNYGYERLVP